MVPSLTRTSYKDRLGIVRYLTRSEQLKVLGPVRTTLNRGESRRTREMIGAPRQSEDGLKATRPLRTDAKVSCRSGSVSDTSRNSAVHVKGLMEKAPMASLRPVASSTSWDAWLRKTGGATKATNAAKSRTLPTTANAALASHLIAHDPALFTDIGACFSFRWGKLNLDYARYFAKSRYL